MEVNIAVGSSRISAAGVQRSPRFTPEDDVEPLHIFSATVGSAGKPLTLGNSSPLRFTRFCDAAPEDLHTQTFGVNVGRRGGSTCYPGDSMEIWSDVFSPWPGANGNTERHGETWAEIFAGIIQLKPRGARTYTKSRRRYGGDAGRGEQGERSVVRPERQGRIRGGGTWWDPHSGGKAAVEGPGETFHLFLWCTAGRGAASHRPLGIHRHAFA